MRVLITGGNGFVARNLREQLGEPFEVMAVGRSDLDLMEADKVYHFIKEGNFEAVVHTATYDAVAVGSTKDPALVLENNLKMFFNVARCQDFFKKMVYFGSGAEFNREYWVPRMKEDYFDCHVPTDQYGFSKYVMTKYAMVSDKIYNLRLFGNFGKYDDWRTRLIPNVCYQVITDLPVKIQQNKFYDFLYVNDLVRVVKWLMISKPKRKVYNLCTGGVIDYKSVAEKIIKISGKKKKLEMAVEGLGQEYSGDNSLLFGEMKGFEFTPFDEALVSLYNWYDQNKEEIFK